MTVAIERVVGIAARYQPTNQASIELSYASMEFKRAPRRFQCSDCKRTIERGSTYMRLNHGRYCISCGNQYKHK